MIFDYRIQKKKKKINSLISQFKMSQDLKGQKMLKFINNRNDCYLNSVLQALFNTHSFICFFKFKKTDENQIIQTFRVIYEMNTLINPRNIKNLLATYDRGAHDLFGNNEQQDAHEAIVKILDIIHMSSAYNESNYSDYGKIDSEIKRNSFNAWKKSGEILGFSFITRFFGGQFKTLTCCTNCDHKITSFDYFNNINLTIAGEDIVDCLAEFIKPEILHDSKCEKCHKKTRIRVTTLWKFPLTLILNIKRFTYDQSGITRKVNRMLKMDKYLKIRSSKRVYNYTLTSVVYHHGSHPNAGHYNADLNKNGTWYKLDDDSAYKLDDLPEASSNCYILVYNFG
jgi:ubiquitin C-terminal hydrolase